MTDNALSYKTMIDPFLSPGFTFRELVHAGLQNRQLPPSEYWERIMRPLELANDLRARMMARGARGLLIHAAYRPKGGAMFSAHRVNRALDLDLLPSDYDLSTWFVQEAVTLLCTLGHNEPLRIGIYGKPGSCASIRVHVDTCGGGRHAARGWQHYSGKVISLEKSDIASVASQCGLSIPPRR